MELTAYECPRCEYVADHIRGALTADYVLQVRCPRCRHVEKLPGVTA